jgi:hypothetical protein
MSKTLTGVSTPITLSTDIGRNSSVGIQNRSLLRLMRRTAAETVYGCISIALSVSDEPLSLA